MEIVGNIVTVTDEYFRIKTIKKKQNLDIFFTENKIEGIDSFYEPHMVTRIEVEPQEFEHAGYKYAKLWLKYVVFPKRNREDQCNTAAAFRQREKVAVLFRKEDLED